MQTQQKAREMYPGCFRLMISGSLFLVASTTRNLIPSSDNQHQIILCITKGGKKKSHALNYSAVVCCVLVSVSQCYPSKETLSKPLAPLLCLICIIYKQARKHSHSTTFFWRLPYNVAFMILSFGESDAYACLAPCRSRLAAPNGLIGQAQATFTSRRCTRKAQKCVCMHCRKGVPSVKRTLLWPTKGVTMICSPSSGQVYVEKRWRIHPRKCAVSGFCAGN